MALKLLFPNDLLNMPPPEWIMQGVLQTASTALLYGPPGLGKSFLALELAFAIAAENSTIFPVERSGPVVYVAGEGVAGIGVRLKAWQKDRRINVSDNFAIIGKPVQLASKKGRGEFIKLLNDNMDPPQLVIFDTLARCAVGLDENSAKDMGMVVEGVDIIRESLNTTILLVHHSTKSNAKTERGSGAIYGAVDTAFSLSPDARKYIKLECQKQKNGERLQTRSLELRPIDLGGLDRDSCVIRADRDAKTQTQKDKAIELITSGQGSMFINKRMFIELLYPLISFEVCGPVISVSDPGGSRFMLEPADTKSPEYQKWLAGPKSEPRYVSFPPDTNWDKREDKLDDLKAGNIKHLCTDEDLNFWYYAVSINAAKQKDVAEWYGLARSTFGDQFRRWKSK